MKVNGSERGSRPLQGFANYMFELRQPSADDQPEIVRRKALKRLLTNDLAGARESVADLIRLHPNSYEAYEILAMIAEQEGRPTEAAGHRAAAKVILQSGRDQLLIKHSSRERLQQLQRSKGVIE